MGKGKKEEKKEREECMLKNGSLLLEKRISYFGGRYSNPIHNFSIQEIQRATDNFNGNLIFNDDVSSFYKWYKGSLEGRVICIRKIFRSSFAENPQIVTNEIAVATQMSSHKNALKLLGCCLETRVPILVYEFSSCEPLAEKIFDCNEPFPLKGRLKIAYEIASVIAYLHTAFPRPIIHRDIKPHHFFLDNGSTPKLSNFELSIALPEGETRVKDVPRGTLGYLAPELFSWEYTEKTDVFSFGTLILELLTRRRASFLAKRKGVSMRKHGEDHIETYGIHDILDPSSLVEGGGVLEQQQFEAVCQLALKCTEEFAEDRPTIVDAAKEIRRIQRYSLPYKLSFAKSVFNNDFEKCF
ncbi:non-functional pseudokinase ZED1 isoform X1 [Vitis vinifera]|uniref:non-functional pseudokinase ZED1 isoform X1 n=1 Tax=Vitis vinifera TaxID=29760 RepID=UPI0028830CA8|nr:non-functional pseudokinase ZED1 isoform X1 [Vitis vinifera]XP_059590865.1 non-functional pseudokinase ZED1 isoform X1 [Vitis vinifera]